jgi:hypothetical protein
VTPARTSFRHDVAIAAALGVVATIVVGVTAQSLGFTRDEGYYFKAGELYWGWYRELFQLFADGEPLRAFSREVIDRHWSYNREHPALMKTLFAWSFGFSELTGFPAGKHNALRFPAWCVAGLSVSLVYALARTLLPRRAAVVAALSWISMPHVFWHMHLACFDVPVAAAHTALVLAYLRYRHTFRGAVLVGVVFGLAAAVKHNVLPVPGLLLLHWLVVEAGRGGAMGKGKLGAAAAAASARGASGVVLPGIPIVFFSLAIVGPLVYLLTWPFLWPQPLLRLGSYLGFHLRHEHYPILYFEELLTKPPFPWHFPFVMSAVTIPVPVLMMLLLGTALAAAVAGRFLRQRFAPRGSDERSEPELTRTPLGDVSRAPSASPALLLLLNGFYPFILIALPATPIFGGTKHWMNGLPFLCVLGAWALEEGFRRLEAAAGARARVAFLVTVALVVVPGVWISARVWPYGLGSYNELIGFARGAANVGMQRTFWGYEPFAALDAFNERTPRNGRIHFGDTNQDSWRMYRRSRGEAPPLLREDIGFSGTVRGSAVASVQPQGEFKQQWMDVWNEWGDRTPDLVLHAEGVPVCTVTFKGSPHKISKGDALGQPAAAGGARAR